MLTKKRARKIKYAQTSAVMIRTRDSHCYGCGHHCHGLWP